MKSKDRRRALPSVEDLRALLAYDPESGVLTWKARPGTSPSDRKFNARHAGKPAGCTDREGYLVVGFQGRKHRAHRVGWAVANGAWPHGEIDHINGVRDDNRLCNLRDVTSSANQRNATLRADNTSGRVGVYYLPDKGRWAAKITLNGRLQYLGSFLTYEEAAAAREAAEREHGFHPNHGRQRKAA